MHFIIGLIKEAPVVPTENYRRGKETYIYISALSAILSLRRRGAAHAVNKEGDAHHRQNKIDGASPFSSSFLSGGARKIIFEPRSNRPLQFHRS